MLGRFMRLLVHLYAVGFRSFRAATMASVYMLLGSWATMQLTHRGCIDRRQRTVTAACYQIALAGLRNMSAILMHVVS